MKTLRELRGWSQRELSRRCGLSENIILRYERNEIDPTAASLKTLADVLEVSADYLIGISDDPRRQPHVDARGDDEQQILEMYRLEGWPGVFRLGADRMHK